MTMKERAEKYRAELASHNSSAEESLLAHREASARWREEWEELRAAHARIEELEALLREARHFVDGGSLDNLIEDALS